MTVFSQVAKKVSTGARHFWHDCSEAATSFQVSEATILTLVPQQALDINLKPLWYGVLAEIGAGQVNIHGSRRTFQEILLMAKRA